MLNSHTSLFSSIRIGEKTRMIRPIEKKCPDAQLRILYYLAGFDRCMAAGW